MTVEPLRVVPVHLQLSRHPDNELTNQSPLRSNTRLGLPSALSLPHRKDLAAPTAPPLPLKQTPPLPKYATYEQVSATRCAHHPLRSEEAREALQQLLGVRPIQE